MLSKNDSNLGKRKKSQLAKKESAVANEKKELSKSISRAREEHRRNMDEINQINDSVKYDVKKSERRSTMMEKNVLLN